MKLFIGIPCYRSSAEVQGAWCKAIAEELKIDVQLSIVPGQARVHFARACLAGLFLKSTCDAWLMKDDDIWCLSDVVQRLISSDASATVAPYVVRLLEQQRDARIPVRFDVGFLSDGSVEAAGNGLCIVRRHVIEKMWVDYREELYFVDQANGELVQLWHEIFGRDENGIRRNIGEDVSFWWRVRNSGFHIEALNNVETVHAGERATFVKGQIINIDNPLPGRHRDHQ